MEPVITYDYVMSGLNKLDNKYNTISKEIYSEETAVLFNHKNGHEFHCEKQNGDVIVWLEYNNGPLAQGSYGYLFRNGILISIGEGDLKS